MSLILEALKRSEAQRQQSQTTAPVAEATGRRVTRAGAVGRWLLLGAGVSMLGLAAGFAFWQILAQRTDGSGATPTAVLQPALPGQRSVTFPVEQGKSGPGRLAPGDTPAAGLVRPDRRDIAAAGPAASEITFPGELTGEAGRSAVERADAGISQAVQTENSSLTREPELHGPERGAAQGGLPAAVTVTSFRRLPFETRQALGSLRLDAHVFDDDPSRRFVMINGKTLGVGGEVKPGLAVDQIVRQGVVLTWKGQSFILGRGD